MNVKVPVYPKSKSRNVNAYVRAVATQRALSAAMAAAGTDAILRRAKLTGGQLGEAIRVLAEGPQS